MLPRLRFVVAAAIIAALPWLVFNSGLVTDLPSSSIAEYSRSSAASLSVSDLREAREMYLMSYVRRSRELEKLRVLASAPLTDWISTPSGEPELATGKVSSPPAEIKTTEIVALPTPEPALVAEPKSSGPAPQPVETENAQQLSTVDVANEQAATRQTDQPEPAKKPSPEKLVALDLDRPRKEDSPTEPSFLPPLPHARPARTPVKRTVRQPRVRYAAQAQPQPLPNPFNGPPATPTLTNNFMQTYGKPQ